MTIADKRTDRELQVNKELRYDYTVKRDHEFVEKTTITNKNKKSLCVSGGVWREIKKIRDSYPHGKKPTYSEIVWTWYKDAKDKETLLELLTKRQREFEKERKVFAETIQIQGQEINKKVEHKFQQVVLQVNQQLQHITFDKIMQELIKSLPIAVQQEFYQSLNDMTWQGQNAKLKILGLFNVVFSKSLERARQTVLDVIYEKQER
ncbi:MAG: hypothetical protein ACFE8J_08750 [Candidatus Heimdallarchaeota archaeon]